MYTRGRERGSVFMKSGGPASVRAQAKLAARQVGWPIEKLIQGVIAYDRERLDAVPSLKVYPELKGYRDRLDQSPCFAFRSLMPLAFWWSIADSP